MPILGETKTGRDIGLIHRGKEAYIWAACLDCGKERWVRHRKRDNKIASDRCGACGRKKAGQSRRRENNPRWKRGNPIKRGDGYLLLSISPNDFFYSMADTRGYVLEHRLVMAQHLGRCLQFWEIVHHKNGIKTDNRWKNLETSTLGSHTIEHSKGYRDGYQRGLIDGRDQQIKELRDEIKLLQWQIAEFIKQGQAA